MRIFRAALKIAWGSRNEEGLTSSGSKFNRNILAVDRRPLNAILIFFDKRAGRTTGKNVWENIDRLISDKSCNKSIQSS